MYAHKFYEEGKRKYEGVWEKERFDKILEIIPEKASVLDAGGAKAYYQKS